jgi:hypothetical protein
MKIREDDIQELCKAVKNAHMPQDYNRGTVYCPFCLMDGAYDDEMDDIKHGTHCAYLIAKDLSA